MTPALFPAFIKLAGRPCVVVGAGSVAASKITSLLECGAQVTVIAPHAAETIGHLSATRKLRWLPRKFAANDLTRALLVIAATSDPGVNRAVFREAQNRGILCNSVDDPPNCDFYFPAVVRRGPLQIAISTSGESPALAQRIRLEIEESLHESLGDWVEEIGEARRKILAVNPPSDERKKLLHRLAQSDLAHSKTTDLETQP
jgi:precorrin-2 dehydrogenase/sirohydrochlorin ferrochelatase